MEYVRESLGLNEKLIYLARFHRLYYIIAWLCITLFSILTLWTLFSASGFMRWILVILWLAGLGVVLALMIPIWTTEIAVTNHRLVIKHGWLSRSTTELQLKSIEQVNLHQGLLGRLLDFGKIIVHGTGVDDLELPNIARPTELIKAIENASLPIRQLPLAVQE